MMAVMIASRGYSAGESRDHSKNVRIEKRVAAKGIRLLTVVSKVVLTLAGEILKLSGVTGHLNIVRLLGCLAVWRR